MTATAPASPTPDTWVVADARQLPGGLVQLRVVGPDQRPRLIVVDADGQGEAAIRVKVGAVMTVVEAAGRGAS